MKTEEKEKKEENKTSLSSNKFFTTTIPAVTLLVLTLWMVLDKNYLFDFIISQLSIFKISAIQISLAANFLLLTAIFLLLMLMIHINNKYKTESLAKEHSLKAIDQITFLKLSASNIEDLVDLVCKKLEENLGGKFWLFLAGKNQQLNCEEPYILKAKEVLINSRNQLVRKRRKIIYFQKVAIGEKKFGVLIAEVKPQNDFIYLRKILPDQIAVIISNFEMRTKLNEARVNQEREKLRSLILSSISHDLKTPLSSIIGSLNIFKDLSNRNKLDKESKETLITTAIEEAERLKSFIDDVLEMTRIESGAIKLQKQFLSSSIIVERTLKRFEEKLKDYEVEISLDKKIKINFDQTSCEQIIQNLVDNTIKYSPKNTKINIWDSLENETYSIFIKDEGKGIHPEKLNMIFNKFERFAMEDKVVGSGLGLSIVKALMEANNAAIHAKNSECGKGAIFVLEFRDFKNESTETILQTVN
ncbi:MAG: sensor protein KdpD [Rickettsiaceae bacterium]|jgi:K+-sensing histidine kinase KdpD|nr:sensor protein KdpD [Rickettsiaceae bacterium]